MISGLASICADGDLQQKNVFHCRNGPRKVTFLDYSQLINNKFDNDVWNFISLVWESNCQLAITTVQDLLELDYKGRFNIPGTSENNWIWRLDNFDSLKNVTNVLKELNHSTNRN